MRGYLLLVFLFALGQGIFAQTQRIDSLRQLSRRTTGVDKVDALNAFSFEVFSYDYAQSVKASQEALDIAKSLGYDKGAAKALLYEGIIELTVGHDTLSRRKFFNCVSFCDKSKEEQLKGNAYTYIGISFQNSDRLDSAEFFYGKAYRSLKDSLNPLYLSFLYLNLGKLNELKNNSAQQLKYLNKSWEIRRKMKDKRPLVYAGRDLAVYYTEQGNYKKSTEIIDELQTALGKDTVDNEEISIIYKERAIIYADQGDYRTALKLFAKARVFFERNESQLELVNLFTDVGHVLSFASNNFETSLKYFFKAIELAESNHFQHEVSLLYARVSWVYFLMEQYKLSEKFSLKALAVSQNKYPYEEASALNLLGLINTRENKHTAALDYLNRALGIRKKNNYKAAEASTLLNLGILFEQMGEFQKAEEYDLKSLAIDQELNNATDLSYSYQSLGQLYTKMKKYGKALEYLNRGEVLSKKIKANDIVSDIYKNKRDLYGAQSNYKEAYKYSILYEHMHDSLFNQNLSNRISAMQYDYELDQRDNEIKILNQQRQLQQDRLEHQQTEIRQQRFIIIIGIVFLAALCIVSYVIYSYYQKVKKLNFEVAEQNEEITVQAEELRESNEMLGKLNREISEQKEEIQSQAEELVESNQAIGRINEGLEEKIKDRTNELKEAYRELDTFFYRSSHDFRRPLTTFMGLAEVANVMVKEPAALELFSKVKDTAQNLDKMLMKLQSVSLVGSDELTKSETNLESIFQAEVHHFQNQLLQKKIHVVIKAENKDPFYSYPALIKVIVQNLLENSIAFSAEEKPVIELSAVTSGDQMRLRVADNGQGIDNEYLPRICEMYFRANEKSTGNGLGLYIVKKMVDKLQGTIHIESQLGKGTIVTILLPNRLSYVFK